MRVAFALNVGFQHLMKCRISFFSLRILDINESCRKAQQLCYINTTANNQARVKSFKKCLHHYLEEHEYFLGAMRASRQGYLVNNSEEGEAVAVFSVSEPFNSTSPNWAFSWFKPFLESKDMYVPSVTCTSVALYEEGYKSLDKYLNGQNLDPPVLTAVNALERFFYEKGYHQKCLAFLQRQKSETAVAALLGQHLLAQLLPYPSNYFLDNRSKFKPDVCPCGCGELIHYGLTHLGSPILFQGYADMVLFPTNKDLFLGVDKSTSAVFTIKRKNSEEFGHRLMNNEWNSDERFDEEISVEECKQINVSDESTVRQLCKQAISTSLCKYKRIHDRAPEQNNVSMIPVCVITKDSYEVAVYDAENDFLLKSEPLTLFKDVHTSTLQFSSVVDLWMLINHSLFCTEPHPNTIDNLKGTCSLIPQLGKEKFDSIVNNSHWLLSPETSKPVSFSKVKSTKYQQDNNGDEYEYPLKKSVSAKKERKYE